MNINKPVIEILDVRVHGFKSYFEDASISIGNLNILLGCNGSGKSSWIEAIKWLVNSIDSNVTLGIRPHNNIEYLNNNLFDGEQLIGDSLRSDDEEEFISRNQYLLVSLDFQLYEDLIYDMPSQNINNFLKDGRLYKNGKFRISIEIEFNEDGFIESIQTTFLNKTMEICIITNNFVEVQDNDDVQGHAYRGTFLEGEFGLEKVDSYVSMKDLCSCCIKYCNDINVSDVSEIIWESGECDQKMIFERIQDELPHKFLLLLKAISESIKSHLYEIPAIRGFVLDSSKKLTKDNISKDFRRIDVFNNSKYLLDLMHKLQYHFFKPINGPFTGGVLHCLTNKSARDVIECLSKYEKVLVKSASFEPQYDNICRTLIDRLGPLKRSVLGPSQTSIFKLKELILIEDLFDEKLLVEHLSIYNINKSISELEDEELLWLNKSIIDRVLLKIPTPPFSIINYTELWLKKLLNISFQKQRHYKDSPEVITYLHDVIPDVPDVIPDSIICETSSDPNVTNNFETYYLRNSISDNNKCLSDYSTGIHQILPIMLQVILMVPGETIFIENPEVHLHPDLIIKITEFFINQTKMGKKIIIETHCDLIVMRIMRAILSEEISQSSCNIYFTKLKLNENVKFSGSDQNAYCSYIEKILINEQGHIENWPEGFMDVRLKESQRLMEVMYGYH